eukprot:4029-Heterococcus_DN1.PRE.7
MSTSPSSATCSRSIHSLMPGKQVKEVCKLRWLVTSCHARLITALQRALQPASQQRHLRLDILLLVHCLTQTVTLWLASQPAASWQQCLRLLLVSAANTRARHVLATRCYGPHGTTANQLYVDVCVPHSVIR